MTTTRILISALALALLGAPAALRADEAKTDAKADAKPAPKKAKDKKTVAPPDKAPEAAKPEKKGW